MQHASDSNASVQPDRDKDWNLTVQKDRLVIT